MVDIRRVTEKERAGMRWVYERILCDCFIGEKAVSVYKRLNGDVRLDLECINTKVTLMTVIITKIQYERILELRQHTDSKKEFLEDVVSWMISRQLCEDRGLPTTLWKIDKDVDICN